MAERSKPHVATKISPIAGKEESWSDDPDLFGEHRENCERNREPTYRSLTPQKAAWPVLRPGSCWSTGEAERIRKRLQ